MDFFVIAHLDAVNKCLAEDGEAPVNSVRALSQEKAESILSYLLSDKHDMDGDGYLYDVEMWAQEQLGYEHTFQRFHQEQIIRFGQAEGDILVAMMVIGPDLDDDEDDDAVTLAIVRGVSLSDIMHNITSAASRTYIAQAAMTRIEIAPITRNGKLDGAHVWFISQKHVPTRRPDVPVTVGEEQQPKLHQSKLGLSALKQTIARFIKRHG